MRRLNFAIAALVATALIFGSGNVFGYDSTLENSKPSITISSSSDAVDVSATNTVLVDTSGGDVTIGGLSGGGLGREIIIFKNNTANNMILEHDEPSGSQKLILPKEEDSNFPTTGGILFYFDGTAWIGIGSVSGSTASDISVETIGSPVVDTVQEMLSCGLSAGIENDHPISDAGGGSIDVSMGEGFIRTIDSHTGPLKAFTWLAASGIAIPSGSLRYIGVEYNAGSPQVTVRTGNTFDGHDDFILGTVVNEGGTLHIVNSPQAACDTTNHIFERFYETDPWARANRLGGLIIGETGTRNITLTAGELYDGLNEFTITSKDTSVSDTIDLYYRDGVGGFTKVAAQTQWNNTQYDDGSGTLQTMSSNRYANVWLWIEADDALVGMYGQGEYTSIVLAEGEGVPASIPLRLQSHGKFVGRFVFQKDASVTTSIASAFTEVLTSSAVTDHNSLSGLQGGTAGEYYHLTATEAGYINQDVSTGSSPSFATPTVTSFANATHNHSDAAGGGTIAHASTTGQTSDDHHPQLHTVVSHSDTTATGAELNTLVAGANTTLHYHDADRSRANHTGTQLASTISDFQTTVSSNSDVSANTTHRTSDGTDHTYINQDLRTTSSPTFADATLSGMTSGSVFFAGAGGAINEDNSNFYWDDTSNELGIGTNAPSSTLDVVGNIEATSLAGTGSRIVQASAGGVLSTGCPVYANDTLANIKLISSPAECATVWATDLDKELRYTGNSWQVLGETIEMVNKSGSALTEGDTVILDVGNNQAVTTTNVTTNLDVIGPVAVGGANDAYVAIAVSGLWDVYLNSAGDRGYYVETRAAYGEARDQASAVPGSFGQVVESTGGAGLALCWIASKEMY